jgi:uncharacterized membrane protein
MATKTGTGLKKETAAALSYLLGPVTGIIFLILEKDSFVRFHAMQSIVGLGVLGVLLMFIGWIPLFGMLVWLVYIGILLYGMYQASQGKMWVMPVLGRFAKQLLGK